MEHALDAQSAARASLSAYLDPYLGQTLGEAKAITDLALRDGVLHAELKFGFPVADYRE